MPKVKIIMVNGDAEYRTIKSDEVSFYADLPFSSSNVMMVELTDLDS